MARLPRPRFPGPHVTDFDFNPRGIPPVCRRYRKSQTVATWTECYCPIRSPSVRSNRSDVFSCFNLPESDRAVVTCRSKPSPIRAEVDTSHGRCVLSKCYHRTFAQILEVTPLPMAVSVGAVGENLPCLFGLVCFYAALRQLNRENGRPATPFLCGEHSRSRGHIPEPRK